MTDLRVHVLQHAAFEDIGSLRGALARRGATIGYTRLFAGDRPPDADALGRLDLLVAMGGPMSVNDEQALPWLVAEKQAVRDAVTADVAVLGVCLGAQLIASALGARVYPNRAKEIGWFPIQAANDGDDVGAGGGAADVFHFPREITVLHWHGETFDLPAQAVRLASSDGCLNQAFQIGPRVIGLQFHLEATPDGASALVDHCGDELTPGPFVQTEEALRAAPASRYDDGNALMESVLDYLLRAPART